MRTTEDWINILILCGCKEVVAEKWGPVFSDTIKVNSFSKGDEELDDFLGQVLHESNHLESLVENLNYSAEGLNRVWPSRFPTVEFAKAYARNPEKIANFVYSGRMGNTKLGDGWKYRGRGPIQITGFDNYVFVGKLLGQDLDVNPELLEQPHYALEATIAWWENRIPDSMLGDIEKVTRRVNGGIIGLREREEITSKAKKALK